jgi:hypothetical protein
MARNGRVPRYWAWLALLLAPVGAGSAEAAGVVGNGTPGSCTEAALNAALAGGGTVTFNCGGSPVSIPITSQKVVSAATVVDGGNNALVTLDAAASSPRSRHFTTTDGIALTIRNLTLRNGRCPVPDPGQPSPGYGGSIRSGITSPLTIQDSRFIDNACDVAGIDVGGGAIRQRRGALLVQRTLFQGNRAGNAGAISSSDSVATIEDSTFTGNTTNAHTTGFSGVGGGFYNDESGNGLVTIRRTSFVNNSATFAAGALQSFFVPGDLGLVLEDCTFQGNSSPTSAGGALVQLGPLVVTGSTFSGNSAQDGAGLYINTSGSAQVTNSTFSGNTATGTGGGIFAGNSTTTLSHLTVANNQATASGPAIAYSGGSASLRGSIIANNTGAFGQCNAPLGNGGFNVQFPSTGSCSAGATIADPQLQPLANNGGPTQTRAIGSASPARNLVTSGCPPPATDQRGVSRPAGACDAGSFELNSVVSLQNTSVTEGNTGSTPATFTATLSQASSQTVTVFYFTANGTAIGGSDYSLTSGTLTFPPGTTSRTFDVPVLGDTLDEDDETFTANLSNPVNAAIGTGQGVATIFDNDAAPSVSVGDCSVLEGGACAFGLSLSAASGKTVTVAYATANGTATAGTDYAAASGTVAFPAGTAAAAVNVATIGDAVDELDETFSLNLSSPGNATIGDGTGAGLIDDDDGPAISVSDPAVNEGNAGTTPATFTLSLSAASVQSVTVGFATSDGTASAGSDYAPASGTVTFTPGLTTRTVSVNVNGDGVNEPDERFYLNLSNPVDGSLAEPAGQATIRDDDGGVILVRELAQGSSQRDGFAGGADIYVMAVPARTSWEVVLDEGSGDAGGASGPNLQRVDNDLATVLQDSAAVGGTGRARTLRWQNAASTAEAAYVRVSSAQCGTDCGADDTYRLRAYETTLQVPRFNNAGSQLTVLVLQNPTNASISGSAYFWSGAGVLLGTHAFSLPARASAAVSTPGVSGVAGQSGSVTIVHSGRYGELMGKTVALEPSTGFSFDAVAVPRRR